MVTFFILVLAMFPSAPGHMHKPVQRGVLTYDTREQCEAGAKAWRGRLAHHAGTRYTSAACLAITVRRGTVEDT